MTAEDGASETYTFVTGINIRVKEGDVVKKGDMIVGGSINPHDILRVVGITGVQNYIIEEVQKVYNMQGVKINDRHIEVIVRQMLRKIKVDDAGDTTLLPGSMVDISEFNAENEIVRAEGKNEATGSRALLGITKASLATESFLSAASFQETTRVLTEAAIKSKRDPLLGLKENVIIGKLIPAGTGMSRYKDIDIDVETLKKKAEMDSFQFGDPGSERTFVFPERPFGAVKIEENDQIKVQEPEDADDADLEDEELYFNVIHNSVNMDDETDGNDDL